ncbi:alpha/beta hydrolase [Sphingomonas sp. AR_OL41]|uniref:alpha/beta fold hydrolase n=1 Tax=Sphingomonas sp. AR_OL41 TaxID=3042729 RepID=UPI002480DF09|nr:alpha/beta hydrolase [Sphingomonas sp. AR_OL41]MDH7974440.1 alpha/beta hydrolase [Sphingomonas sp. AR_OL41]
MPTIRANGLDIFYEEAGKPTDPVVLLVMGLGTQLIAWPNAFVDGLVAAGLRVIAFDNRDIGLSTHLHGARAPHPLFALAAQRFGLPFRTAYTLRDMAADAVGLLDALGIDRAHVVGASMGGMIAQHVAAGWPDRTLSLTSIMSSSGARGLPGPTPELRKLLMGRPADTSRDAAIAATMKVLEAISYPDAAREADAYQTMAARAYDRSFDPLGTRRQLLAIITDRQRTALLATIAVPTLVIHGAADPLVPLANGEDTARRIPNARLEVIDGMAHDLPPSQVDRLVALLAEHATGVSEMRAAA